MTPRGVLVPDPVADQVHRLQAAYRAATGNELAAHGAEPPELDALAKAFPGLHVPDELFDLLKQMNGSGGEVVLAGSGSPLLSAPGIVAETELRRQICAEQEQPFSPGWVVFAAEGWGHCAVIAQRAKRSRSVVVELSYGNQAYPIVASSLTAWIAASADAWEAGTHDRQVFDVSEQGQRAYRDTHPSRHALIDKRGREFPSNDGLTRRDAVDFDPMTWPTRWPTGGQPRVERGRLHTLEDLLARRGSAHDIEAVVVERRGRWWLIRHNTTAWLDVPTALSEGRQANNGQRITVAAMNDHAPEWLEPPPDPSLPAIRATGIYREA